MKIVINTRLWIPKKIDGIGRFTKETVNLLASMMPEHEFVFLFDRPFDPSLIFEKNVKTHVMGPQTRLPILIRLWFQIRIPLFLRHIKADLFISPDSFIPYKTKTKTLSVVHDINYVHYPDFLPKKWLRFYNENMPKIIENADRIATVSNFSKNDIVEYYKCSPEKIDVYCNSASDMFFPLNQEEQQEVRNQYTQGKEYFLFVGTMHPRKNLSRVMRAFDHFKQQTNNTIKFVVVGRKMFLNEEFDAVFKQLKHKEDVIFLSSMGDDVLPKIYASAHALCYVSVFEGFGIPIIECFKSATPVITSNTSSMPEVAGDAALIVNPFIIEEITKAMICSCNEDKAQELITKGLERHHQYTWERCVLAMKASIDKIFEQSH